MWSYYFFLICFYALKGAFLKNNFIFLNYLQHVIFIAAEKLCTGHRGEEKILGTFVLKQKKRMSRTEKKHNCSGAKNVLLH